MSVTVEFAQLIKDALAPLGHIAVQRMFGGAGIYCDGIMFGLVGDGVIYLKADDLNKKDFEAESLGPFVYHGKGRPIQMSYWQAPERLLDDPDEMREWAAKAIAAARRAKAGQTSKRKRPPTKDPES